MPLLRPVILALALATGLVSFACGQSFGPTASVVTASPDPAHEVLSSSFQDATDVRSRSRLTAGNRLELLENGAVSFPRKHALIAGASSHVMVMTMVWKDDSTGRSLADALVQRARAGVAVRAIVDGRIADGDIVLRLRRGGVRVAQYNPGFLLFSGGGPRSGHMHEKLVCADLRRAIVGGMNVGDSYALGDGFNDRNHDVDLLVEGDAAGEAAVRFLELYTSLAPGDGDATALLGSLRARATGAATPPPGRDGYARHIVNEPDLHREGVTDYYERVIRSARGQVVWHVNNLIPVDPLASELRAAGRRGTRVVIITNSKKAYQKRMGKLAGLFVYHGLKALYRRRVKSPGIEIHELDVPIHSKVLTVDGVLASIGSYNVGPSSVEKNTEQVLVTYDPPTVRAVEEMFDRDLARSRRVQ